MCALQVRFQNPPNEVESAHRFTSFQQQILAQVDSLNYLYIYKYNLRTLPLAVTKV